MHHVHERLVQFNLLVHEKLILSSANRNDELIEHNLYNILILCFKVVFEHFNSSSVFCRLLCYIRFRKQETHLYFVDFCVTYDSENRHLLHSLRADFLCCWNLEFLPQKVVC